jgi:tRNA (guanine26-N2/guanine27-N2)-dimethyltransferase
VKAEVTEANTNGDVNVEEHVATNGASGSTANATEQTPTDRNAPVSSNHVKTEPQTDAKSKPEWQPRFRILDALSASGLRALRYASEIPFATEVVANDRDKNAVQSIKINVEHNRLSSSIKATTGDALGHMYSVAFPPTNSHGPAHVSGKYDVVDLDPYGTAAPFIDAALQALEDGGLLCVTSTDSGVFASCGYSEKTYALYGGMPIKGLHSHEGGLRLLLHSIATTASRHGIAIEPLLSLSIDFYARLFIRVRKSAADVKFLAGKTMLVYDCDHGCGAWTTQFIGRHQKHKNSDTNWKFSIAQAPNTNQLCEHCGSKAHLAGPMWAGPLHNPAFIEKILNDLKYADPEIYQTKPRIEGMLDTALDELIVLNHTMDLREGPLSSKSKDTRDIIPRTPPEAIDHHPFFFIPSALCKVIKAVAPPENMVKGALRHAGYKATRSHCRPGSIKTDAPWDVIWEIMREWVRQKAPIKEGALKEIQPGWRILQATRKDEDGREADGEVHEAAVENGTHAPTPDVITEPTAEPVIAEPPTDVKKLKVIFDDKLGKDKPGKRLVRYQENPKENWGPMRKARGTA